MTSRGALDHLAEIDAGTMSTKSRTEEKKRLDIQGLRFSLESGFQRFGPGFDANRAHGSGETNCWDMMC